MLQGLAGIPQPLLRIGELFDVWECRAEVPLPTVLFLGSNTNYACFKVVKNVDVPEDVDA